LDTYGTLEDLPILAELYDFVPAYNNRADIAFYVDRCKEISGNILELACGSGRILVPAAKAGCSMTGIDISEPMLARCRDKIDTLPESDSAVASLIVGNMVEFSLGKTFDRIIIPGHSFLCLIDVTDQVSCLQCAHRHLNAGGTLIFDVFQVDMNVLAGSYPTPEVEHVSEIAIDSGRRMRCTHRILALHQSAQYREIEINYYLTDRDGHTERYIQQFPFRYAFRYEVEHLLARTGFLVKRIYGDYDKSPIAEGSPEMIFIAEKS